MFSKPWTKIFIFIYISTIRLSKVTSKCFTLEKVVFSHLVLKKNFAKLLTFILIELL